MSRNALNAGHFAASGAEIERLCRYIKDDQTVANYFGISRERVERARVNIQPKQPRRFKAERAVYKNASYGYDAHVVDAREAEIGSRNLNEALQRMFRSWEKKHGFQPGAGERLLPAGYSA
jgi:hypothetical protein